MDKRAFYQQPSTALGYDRIRFGSASGYFVHQIEVDTLKSMLPREGQIMELACGTARLLKNLRVEGWSVKGIDQSPRMLETSGLGPDVVTVGDVFELPVPDASLDAAYSLRFTNHYKDLTLFFHECHRVLKPGGHLVFDSMRWSPLIWNKVAPGGRNFFLSDRGVRLLMDDAGFRIEETRPLFPLSPYILAQLPLWFTRAACALGRSVPGRLFPIVIWHARRTR